jgi:hypothetical protein
MGRHHLHLYMFNSLNKLDKMKIIIEKQNGITTYNGKTVSQMLSLLPTTIVTQEHIEYVVNSFSNQIDWPVIIKGLKESGFEPVLIIALFKNVFNISLGEASNIYDENNNR